MGIGHFFFMNVHFLRSKKYSLTVNKYSLNHLTPENLV